MNIKISAEKKENDYIYVLRVFIACNNFIICIKYNNKKKN